MLVLTIVRSQLLIGF